MQVSTNDGKTWSEAVLGNDLGRFSFREWSFVTNAKLKGRMSVIARATNAIGQTQVAKAIFNPAGYHHNVMHRIELDIA